MSVALFPSMMSRCNNRTEKEINYVEFLEKLKVDVRPGDVHGLSTQISNGSFQREVLRQEDLNYRYYLLYMIPFLIIQFTLKKNTQQDWFNPYNAGIFLTFSYSAFKHCIKNG